MSIISNAIIIRMIRRLPITNTIRKMNELKRLEREHPEYVTPDSPTQKVGGSAKREAGVLVEHNVPMLSLQDVFDRGEVENFVAEMKSS